MEVLDLDGQCSVERDEDLLSRLRSGSGSRRNTMKNGVQPRTTKKATSRVPEVEASSGNVFADLGVPDANEALVQAKLAQRICAILSERKLTQARAAALLGVDQPKVSALVT